jgi:hypothetical protein
MWLDGVRSTPQLAATPRVAAGGKEEAEKAKLDGIIANGDT